MNNTKVVTAEAQLKSNHEMLLRLYRVIDCECDDEELLKEIRTEMANTLAAMEAYASQSKQVPVEQEAERVQQADIEQIIEQMCNQSSRKAHEEAAERVYRSFVKPLKYQLLQAEYTIAELQALKQSTTVPNGWISVEKDAYYDGQYYGLIKRTEVCGATNEIQRVVTNKKNKWVLEGNEELLYWMPLFKSPTK
jgi:hypothetical protein